MLNRFSHLGFVFFEDVNVDIRGDFSITMTEVLGNCLNIIAVVNKQAGVAVTKCMNTECWQVVINKDFLQLLVAETPTAAYGLG